MKLEKFTLIAGRHNIPENPPAILDSWNFINKEGIISKKGVELLNRYNCFCDKTGDDTYLTEDDKAHYEFYKTDVGLYVTGLTPALIWVLEVLKRSSTVRSITLLHYDSTTESYWEQPIRF